MFDDAARAFLSRPLIARLATFGTDGYPHVVPLWFYLEGDDIVMISERDTGKIRNLRANPRAALNVGGEPEAGSAYLIRGDITISDDVGHAWTSRITHHYENAEEAARDLEAWKDFDQVVLRLKPASVRKVY